MPSSPFEFAVYLVVFLSALYTVFVIFYAKRRFVSGEFKDFINAVSAAAVAFLLGTLLTLLTTVYAGTLYYSTFLLVAGFALLLTSIYFVKSALMLHKVSKVFGFAEVEKEFERAFKAARRETKSVRVRVGKPKAKTKKRKKRRR